MREADWIRKDMIIKKPALLKEESRQNKNHKKYSLQYRYVKAQQA
jgi:hypothetical protein